MDVKRGERELPHDARLPCNSFRPPTRTVDVIETSQTECGCCGVRNSFRPPLAFYLLCIARTVAATTVQRPPPRSLLLSRTNLSGEKGGKRLKREPRAKYDPVGRSVADTDDSCSDDGGGAEVGHPRKYLEHAKLGTDLL